MLGIYDFSKESKLNLVLATGNKGKLKEFSSYFSEFPINIMTQPENLNIEETGNSFVENARIKAQQVARITREISLADDSGLCVEALNGSPGIYSSRYGINDKDRVERLLNELSTEKNRKAVFICAICLVNQCQEILLEVQGRCNGKITLSPRGINGFGYDPIFEVHNTNLTYAEMEQEKKREIGHRGKAFSLMRPQLTKIFSNLII
tara:strand:+ start:358 stop:978 length:621 start_codon:yes stop_codon:yes gene_type:complete